MRPSRETIGEPVSPHGVLGDRDVHQSAHLPSTFGCRAACTPTPVSASSLGDEVKAGVFLLARMALCPAPIFGSGRGGRVR